MYKKSLKKVSSFHPDVEIMFMYKADISVPLAVCFQRQKPKPGVSDSERSLGSVEEKYRRLTTQDNTSQQADENEVSSTVMAWKQKGHFFTVSLSLYVCKKTIVFTENSWVVTVPQIKLFEIAYHCTHE